MKVVETDFDVDEFLIFRVRKHWFVLTIEVLSVLGVALLPLILYETLIVTLDKFAYDIALPIGIIFMACYSAWLIIMWMMLFNIWTNYYLDTWMLTTKRLIATDHVRLFHRTVATFRLERMQDVIVTTNGIIPTLLKFGNLQIQTAGEEGNFEIRGIGNPEKLKSEILEAAGKASKEMYGGDDGM